MVDVVKYDPNTGELIWVERTPDFYPDRHSAAKFNSRFAGKVAGSITPGGNGRCYRELGVVRLGKRKRLYAHRVIWEMHNGPIPDGLQIDHIDGNSLNNKIENLRLATHSQNLHNRGAQSNNTTGFKGVHRRKSGRYCARIMSGGAYLNLGLFDHPEDAHAAYIAAANKYHGEFAHP